jgi:hypothetical protein
MPTVAQADVAILQPWQQTKTSQDKLGGFDVLGVEVADQGQLELPGCDIGCQMAGGGMPVLQQCPGGWTRPLERRLMLVPVVYPTVFEPQVTATLTLALPSAFLLMAGGLVEHDPQIGQIGQRMGGQGPQRLEGLASLVTDDEPVCRVQQRR